MKGYERFDALVTTSINGRFRSMIIEIKDAFESGTVPDGNTHCFAKLFIYGFNEISNSLKAMRLAETFVKKVMLTESLITNHEYLEYHVHAYLQESYILQKRLECYVKKISRAYSKTPHKNTLKTTEEGLLSCITKAFEGVQRTRGAHVHEKRFNDYELACSGLLAMDVEKNGVPSDLAYHMFGKAAKKWFDKIAQNNRIVSDFVDNYFDYLYRAITQSGQLVTPEDSISQNKNASG